jgi:hypothetical protein
VLIGPHRGAGRSNRNAAVEVERGRSRKQSSIGEVGGRGGETATRGTITSPVGPWQAAQLAWYTSRPRTSDGGSAGMSSRESLSSRVRPSSRSLTLRSRESGSATRATMASSVSRAAAVPLTTLAGRAGTIRRASARKSLASSTSAGVTTRPPCTPRRYSSTANRALAASRRAAAASWASAPAGITSEGRVTSAAMAQSFK